MTAKRTMRTPFPGSWWVEPSKLLAGCFPGGKTAATTETKLVALLDSGVRCVICLQEPEERPRDGEAFAPYDGLLQELAQSRDITVRWTRFPIADCDVPTRDGMKAILDTIDSAMAEGLVVYVHCWGGHGRTGTVMGCWLVRHGLSGAEALRRIRELRRHSKYLRLMMAPQTMAQREFVLNWRESASA